MTVKILTIFQIRRFFSLHCVSCLPVDLCNLCNTSVHLRDVARKSFMLRGSNGINFHLAQSPNGATLLRLLETFGDLITTINISTSIN